MRFSREVVGADLLRALAGADLAAAILGDRVLLLAQLHLVEPRAQHLHRLRAVLDLRLLVLLRDDDAGRDVRDADGGVGRVDALAARAARAERVDAQVLVVDLDVDFLGFRQHGDGAVDVWMRPLASVAGTRCTRCTPLSYFSLL